MADTVKLASLRVSAGMDASNYVKGAEAVTAANEEMSASAKSVGTSVTTTQSKVNAAGDILARLNRQYVPGAAAAQKFDKALRDLQRGFDTGSVSGAQAEQVLIGLNKRFGLMADAEKLAADGQVQLAAAAKSVNASLDASSKVVTTTTASLEHQAKSVSLNRMQMLEMTHVGREMFTMFATGVDPMRALTMESGRIMTFFSMGEGGIGGTLAALAPAALGVGTAMGIAALSVAGLTSAIDANTGKSVSFGDTLKAVFQSIGDGFKSLLSGPAQSTANVFGNLVQAISPGLKAAGNAIVGTFVAAYQDITVTWALLPGAIGDLVVQAAQNVVSGVHDMLAKSTAQIVAWLSALGPALAVFPGLSQLSMAGQSLAIGAAAGKAPILANPYAGDAKLMTTTFASAYGTDYMGKIFGDIQKHALQNAANDNNKKGGGGSKRDPFAEMMTSAANDTRTLQAQAAALGQSTRQTGYLEEKQKLLNRAYQDNIKLSPAQLAAIDGQAKAYGNAKAQLETLTDLYNTGKQASEDFFSTIKQDLLNGTSLWGAFGDAASKVLDDIANKALQMAADGIWDDIWGTATKNGSNSSGGFLSSIISGIGSLFGHNASGTDFWRGGMTWVGERGPELVDLPRGAQVFSNPASMAMMGAANQNSVAIHFSPSYRIDGSGLSAKELGAVMAANNQQVLDLLNRQIVPVVHDALGVKMTPGTRVRNAYFKAA